MLDLKHQNYANVTGTPSLVEGPLTPKTNGLRLSATDTWVVPDSTSDSLAVADGAVGGATLEGWFRIPSLPGTQQVILQKSGSYEIGVTATNKLYWFLANGANSVTVNSVATLQANVWYHTACVLNGDYTGAPQFGYASQGSVQLSMLGDYYKGSPTSGSTYNLQVCKFTAPEKGTLTGIVMDLQRGGDAALGEWIRGVAFKDDAGGSAPGTRLAQSADQRIVDVSSSPPRQWVTFPASGAIYNLPYWIGYEAGESSGIVGIGSESSGGTRAMRRDERSPNATDSRPTGDTVDPFGTVASSDSVKLSVYATYTATGRTGDEGQALIYLNGRLDNATAYTHGIADSANALQHPAGLAVDLKDWAILNRKLTAVPIATHYASR